jgi:hypothetical protein
MQKNAKNIKNFSVVFELLVGCWLLIFSGAAIAKILLASNSSTLLWLVIPMASFGLLALFAGVAIFYSKFITSAVLIFVMLLASVVRWFVNFELVFPVGEALLFASNNAPLTMRVWQTQQFAFVLISLVLLWVTVFLYRVHRVQLTQFDGRCQ